MLLDAYARRCLQSSQQPVYHMHALSAALQEQQQQPPGTLIGQQWQEQPNYPRNRQQQQQQAPVEGPTAEANGVGVQLIGELYGERQLDQVAIGDGGAVDQMPWQRTVSGQQWQG